MTQYKDFHGNGKEVSKPKGNRKNNADFACLTFFFPNDRNTNAQDSTE